MTARNQTPSTLRPPMGREGAATQVCTHCGYGKFGPKWQISATKTADLDTIYREHLRHSHPERLATEFPGN